MLSHLRSSVVMLLLFTLLTGLAYPMLITGFAQLALPFQANGSLVVRNGQVIGSELIGQAFVSDGFFHPRPSATTASDPNDTTKTIDAPYNAANSSGSNLGPTSRKLIERVEAATKSLQTEAGVAVVPADSVTTSASGLDPHISPTFAKLQAPRIAKVRNLSEDRVRALIAEFTELPVFGLFGEPRVNVLRLNLALDRLPTS